VAELLQRLGTHPVRELEVRRGPLRVRVTRDAPAAVPQEAVADAGGAERTGASIGRPEAPQKSYPTIDAPLTGIFYRSPSPQAEAFIQVGSQVTQGQVIGLIEAMKLFNEIRATASGTVRRIMIEGGQLVRAHQPIVELE
jgi:acetyl-CoA carboxylase biotin carboxyl carrier protein